MRNIETIRYLALLCDGGDVFIFQRVGRMEDGRYESWRVVYSPYGEDFDHVIKHVWDRNREALYFDDWDELKQHVQRRFVSAATFDQHLPHIGETFFQATKDEEEADAFS